MRRTRRHVDPTAHQVLCNVIFGNALKASIIILVHSYYKEQLFRPQDTHTLRKFPERSAGSADHQGDALGSQEKISHLVLPILIVETNSDCANLWRFLTWSGSCYYFSALSTGNGFSNMLLLRFCDREDCSHSVDEDGNRLVAI